MDLKELAKLLGLPEDATEEQITQALTAALAELKKLKEDGKEPLPGSEETVANKAVCELLGLKSGAATSDVTAKIMELFQSTLPVRGATAKQHKGTGMFCDKCAIS